jgi:NADH-quinone oxidoreductase subunit L
MQNPGLLFVAATLLPLASFLLLLLAGMVRAAARPNREAGLGRSLYEALGGDTPQKTGAYIATAAIGLAFVLTFIGFILFKMDEVKAETFPEAVQEIKEEQGPTPQAHEKQHEHLLPEHPEKWQGSLTWASLPGYAGRPATQLTLGYRIDSLSVMMFLMVTFVATLIHIFSLGYMSEELQPVVEDHQVHTEHGHLHRRGRYGRFFMFLSLFCFSMLNLILADNLFQVFLSWELVGICSYLLIGFYYERKSASDAAIKAFVTNRIGDAGFILGLLILWTYLGTFNFQEIFSRVRLHGDRTHAAASTAIPAGSIVRARLLPEDDTHAGPRLERSHDGDQVLLLPRDAESRQIHPVVEAQDSADAEHFGYMPYWLLVTAGLGIFLGCVGKSAQFPLHVWLPDAMEGPTPVSALIHAATMVAAGVYLVGRVFPIFTPESRLVIAYTGGITLFMAATIAVVMTDIKKVLAYSTVSQLGYMMLALGVGGWVAGLFHLVTHAFFKALLFLCSGSVIYGCHHEQDMSKMGGLLRKMPVTAFTMLAGVLTIAGIPLFSGWYSKDAILAQAWGFFRIHPEHGLLFWLPLGTAGITAFYMARMWFLTFTGKPRDAHVAEHAHESPRVMTVPLIILAVCSVAIAWGWPVYDATESILNNEINHSQPSSVHTDFEGEMETAHKDHMVGGSLALAVVLLAILFASLIYYSRRLDAAQAKEQFPGVHRFLWNKWYFDELYSAILVRPAVAVAHWCWGFDRAVIDRSVDSLARGTVRLARWDGRFDLGIVDGLVNLIARVAYGVGGWLRTFQTGYLRSYVLFLVLAALVIFFALTYFISLV